MRDELNELISVKHLHIAHTAQVLNKYILKTIIPKIAA